MVAPARGHGRTRALPKSAIPLVLLLCGSTTPAQTPGTESPETTASPSKFRSAEDGWLDVSGFLDEKYGFLPLVMPITEPAVGYGAAGALAFLSKPLGESLAGFGRPDITIVGGLGTENGSWGMVLGDVRHWLDDRLQTQAAFVYSSVNLDFYGIGRDPNLERHPLRYNLEPKGGAGAAYWDTRNTAKATTEVEDVGLVSFEADQGPKHPWNALVGVSAALHHHVDLLVEYGFSPGDVTFFAGGVTIRF
jgi:hypothetical protein